MKNILQEHYDITEKGFIEGLSVEQIMAKIKSELQGPGNIAKEDFITNIIYDLKDKLNQIYSPQTSHYSTLKYPSLQT